MRNTLGLSLTLLIVLFWSGARQSATAADDAAKQPRFTTDVRAILEDSKGNYWFGSWNEGVCRFDGERLTYFTMEDGLTDNQIRSIHEDNNGVIWFECGHGISRYDAGTVAPDTNRNYSAKDDWQVTPGDVWFKSDESVGFNEREGSPGVYRYDGREISYLAFPLPDNRESGSYSSITAIAKGSDRRIWFAMYGGVIGYDGQSFTIIDNKSLGLTEETGFLHVRYVFEDSKERLWIGNNGIGVFLRDGDSTINFTQAHGVGRRDHRTGGSMEPQPGDAPDGAATLHRVFSIGEDRDGNIWFGTVEQGAWRYDGKSLRRFTEEDGLATKSVMCIYTDRRGDLWLGGHGVYKFDGESFDRVY